MNPITNSYQQFYKVWAFIVSVLNLLGLGLALFYGTTLPWIVASVILYGFYIVSMPAYIPRMHLLFGYANWVSIIRLLTIIILLILYPFLDSIILFTLFLIVICLDGVDGYLARKFGHDSEVGGNLDMETDAFLVLVLSWIHVDQLNLDWWILIPGGLKYGYEIFLYWFPKKEGEYIPKKYRATIGVSFFLSLLIPFLSQDSILTLIPYVSGLFIIFSFLASIFYQFNLLK